MVETCDFAIVGGGIVGLATARQLQQSQPGARIVLFEKEDALALHQSGRNSGVIHAGVYYAPGSLKARFCREGKAATRAYCDEHDLPYAICGKLIVAATPEELPRMAALGARARQNGIAIEELSAEEARQLEPNITAAGALLSPSTGIVDFAAVARHMGASFVAGGGRLRLGAEVAGVSETTRSVRLVTRQGPVEAGRAVFCAGLMADRIARAAGAKVDFRIIPFRGDYYRILNQPADLVRHLIYPVPDPERPFLGVHLTRKMDGGFTVGPNAVLAMKREGYGKTDVNLRDLAESLGYGGFWKMLAAHAGSAVGEVMSTASRRRYLHKVRRYCPRIGLADLAPYRAGVRAQAVGRDGRIIDDFLFVQTERSLHVCNAPSPAATSAIPIARHIVAQLMPGA
ncbi:MAG: L-2-hydroxyglutarate oxidase [Paracoccaceae bacterium]